MTSRVRPRLINKGSASIYCVVRTVGVPAVRLAPVAGVEGADLGQGSPEAARRQLLLQHARALRKLGRHRRRLEPVERPFSRTVH